MSASTGRSGTPDGVSGSSLRAVPPATARYLVGWGLTVWVAVYAFVRVASDVLLSPLTPLVLGGFFVAVVPLMAAVTYPVYRRFAIPHTARPTAAVLMSMPGMMLDVGLLLSAPLSLPGLSLPALVNFGAILLFGYTVVLLTGVVPRGP